MILLVVEKLLGTGGDLKRTHSGELNERITYIETNYKDALSQEQQEQIEDIHGTVEEKMQEGAEAELDSMDDDELMDPPEDEDDSDLGGVLLGPIIDFFSAIADAIQTLVTGFMRSDVGWRDVLVGKRLSDDYVSNADDVTNEVDVDIEFGEGATKKRHVKWYNGEQTFIELWASANSSDIPGWSVDDATITASVTEEDVSEVYVRDSKDYDGALEGNKYFIDASGYKNRYSYPRIAYSPEEIFAGDIDLLNANFFDTESIDENSGFYVIRNIVMYWFRALRYLGLAGLLSVLIYTGIKIMTSATAQDKAKYKERIVSWVVGMVIMFLLPYIMSFIFTVSDKLVDIFNPDGANNSIEVYVFDAKAGNDDVTTWFDSHPTDFIADLTGYDGQGHKYTYTKFTTNLMGLVRFQVQSRNVIKMISYFLMYIMLIVFTIRFTVIYLKRMLYIAFLTMISPIVALMYPIDKLGDGKSQSFEMWLKEYTFNALLQPLHMLLYYIFVSSAMSFASENIIYVLVVFGFMTQAEKILKDIFGFGKAGMGTVGGLSGGAATAMTLSALTGTMSNVKKMITPPHNSSNSGNGNQNSNNELESGRDGVDYRNFVWGENTNEPSQLSEREEMHNTPGLDTHDYLDNSETGASINIPMTDEQALAQTFSEDETQRLAELIDNGANPDDAINQIVGERNTDSSGAAPAANTANTGEPRRYTSQQIGTPQALMMMAQRRTQSLRHGMSKVTPKKVIKGIAKGVAKGVALGGSMIVGAGAVLGQAAISLAMDGKYNPLEGVVTFAGATMATNSLMGRAGKAVGNVYSEYRQIRDGDEKHAAKQRRKAFLDNDENFKKYQSKYGDMGYAKLSVEYARGARLAEKGITDIDEQMKVAAYTDSMVEEEFKQKYKGPTSKEDIQRDAEQIRKNAKRNGDKNLEKLSDEDVIKVSMRNMVEAGSTTSKEDLAVNTAKARKEIGENVINSSKDKQEAWIEANSAGDEATANGMRAAIESSQRMNLAVQGEKNRQRKLQEEYNQHNKKTNTLETDNKEVEKIIRNESRQSKLQEKNTQHNKKTNTLETDNKEVEKIIRNMERQSTKVEVPNDKKILEYQLAADAVNFAQSKGGTVTKDELEKHLKEQYKGSASVDIGSVMKTLDKTGCATNTSGGSIKLKDNATDKLKTHMRKTFGKK